MAAPKVKLNNGLEMPVIGLGTADSEPSEVTEAIKFAIDVGYRHFDGAFLYGNEKEIGKGIRQRITDGTVKRTDLFITNKLWCTFHARESVVPACRRSLETLGLDYFDLYLVHAPYGFKEDEKEIFPKDENGKIIFSNVDYIETWTGMEDCVKLGLVKSIGISNFNSQQIDRLLSVAKIKPVVNQIECNPNLNQRKLITFCKERGIVTTAFSPLGRPGYSTTSSTSSVNDPKIIEIARKYNKTSAQIVLRYLIQIEAYPVPKSVHKNEIEENMNISDFEISKQDVDLINCLNRNFRIFPFDDLKDHPYYPFNTEY